ncbi:MAG: hypothetical protein AAGC53_20470 [Actinomycetota bacterium]
MIEDFDQLEGWVLRLASENPARPLGTLASLAGDGFSGIELRAVLVSAAIGTGQAEWLARDLLVRELHRWFGVGRPAAQSREFLLGAALGTWQAHVEPLVTGAAEASRLIFRQLLESEDGWLPGSPDDDWLVELTQSLEPLV